MGKTVFCPDARKIPPPTLLVFPSRACLASANDDDFVTLTLTGLVGEGTAGTGLMGVEGVAEVDVDELEADRGWVSVI